MLENQMRLEELLGREVAIRWYEGVAIIQAACRQQIAREGGGAVFPAASEIVLGADGSVAVLAASSRGAVMSAAQLLARMLSDDVPVRLRLIVAQATGADTAYPTVLDFSNALAYFERPDGAQVLRSLFERAMVAPVRAAMPEAVASGVIQHRPAEEFEGPSQPRKHLRLVVGAAVTLGCVYAVWLVPTAGGFGRLGDALTAFAGGGPTATSNAPGRPKPARTAVGTGGGSTATTTARPSGVAAAAKPAAKPPAAKKATAEAVVDRVARPLGRPSAVRAAEVLPLNPSVGPPAPAPEFRPVFGESVEVTASVANPDDEMAPNGDRIYSRTDAGVTPPRSVYPKLPDPPPGANEQNRTVLELLVGTNGLVERARLRSIPRDIHEFMLVSAAKAWIFEPATVDGLPVRYRHRVAITFP